MVGMAIIDAAHTAQDVPEGTDWDRWLGPAPQREYTSLLCPRGIHKHFPAWRDYREYAAHLQRLAQNNRDLRYPVS